MRPTTYLPGWTGRSCLPGSRRGSAGVASALSEGDIYRVRQHNAAVLYHGRRQWGAQHMCEKLIMIEKKISRSRNIIVEDMQLAN